MMRHSFMLVRYRPELYPDGYEDTKEFYEQVKRDHPELRNKYKGVTLTTGLLKGDLQSKLI